MSIRNLICGLLGIAALAAPGLSRAQTPACNALTDASGNPLPPPIYISGSTALEPVLKSVGPKIASQTSNAHTIVYLSDGSCSGVARIDGDGLIKQNMLYIPPNYDPTTTPTPPQCTVDATTGIPGDLVLADADPSLCPGGSKPAGYQDFQGPVNDMVMVVPSTSTQQAISAEDAYLVFGLGAQGMVSPWTDPNFYYIRGTTSGTRAMITANIGTGTHNWQGLTADPTSGKSFGSGDVFNHVAANATTAPEKTIGILGQDFYDAGNNRSSVKALAFRAFHQRYAYWPDSTLSSRDRRNVRDGRYAIWGYVHMLAAVDASGNPTDAAAKYFIDLMQGNLSPAPTSFNPNDAIVDAHLTPICAMHVTHDIEGGPQKPYTPTASCDCYFEARATGTAPSTCVPCSSTMSCAKGVCRFGYCEAQ